MVFSKKARIFTPLFAKRALLGVCLLLLVFGIFYFFQRDYFFEQRLPKIVSGQEEPGMLFQRKEGDYKEFLSKVKARDIFVSGFKEEVSSSDAERENIRKTIESLRLVGIIAGEPTRVMIEDQKSNRTFYLKEGESLMENIIVETIGKSSVILKAYGEKFELYL